MSNQLTNPLRGAGTTSAIAVWASPTALTSSILSQNSGATQLRLGSNIGSRTFAGAKFAITQVSGGVDEPQAIGIFAEAQGTSTGDSAGVYGHGWTYPGLVAGGLVAGITGEGRASGSTDVSSAIGVRGYSNDTHAGGSNIALYGNATNGATNYALYMNSGNIFSNTAQTWTLASGTSALNIASNLLSLDTLNSRVGVGTASPGNRLDVTLTLASQSGIHLSNGGGANDIARWTANTSTGEILFGQARAGAGSYFLTFYTLGLERMRIDATGASTFRAVANPSSYTIVAQDDIAIYTGTDATGTTSLRLGSSGSLPQGCAVVKGTKTAAGGSGTMTFMTTNGGVLADKMTIDATGNVGVGTASPTAALDLPASTTVRASLRIRSGTAPTAPNDGDIWFDGTNLKMRIAGTTKTFTII